jgi:hypothetical protein
MRIYLGERSAGLTERSITCNTTGIYMRNIVTWIGTIVKLGHPRILPYHKYGVSPAQLGKLHRPHQPHQRATRVQISKMPLRLFMKRGVRLPLPPRVILQPFQRRTFLPGGNNKWPGPSPQQNNSTEEQTDGIFKSNPEWKHEKYRLVRYPTCNS